MSEKMSIQDFYYNQRRIAEKYGIHDYHAGCYICKYDSAMCIRCPRAQKCREIYERELEEVMKEEGS